MRFRQVRRKEIPSLVLHDNQRQALEVVYPDTTRLHANRLQPVRHALLALDEAPPPAFRVAVDAGIDVRKPGRLEEVAVRQLERRGDHDTVLAVKHLQDEVSLSGRGLRIRRHAAVSCSSIGTQRRRDSASVSSLEMGTRTASTMRPASSPEIVAAKRATALPVGLGSPLQGSPSTRRRASASATARSTWSAPPNERSRATAPSRGGRESDGGSMPSSSHSRSAAYDGGKGPATLDGAPCPVPNDCQSRSA